MNPKYYATPLVCAAVIAALGAPLVATAQHNTPYSGLQARKIKALSDQQIADLRTGRGMGLALAAELNGYPGPLHVIELAVELGLSNAQRDKMKLLFNAMRSETSVIGEKLIAYEAELDQQFASRAVTETSLDRTTQTIGSVQAALRAAHLRYHLLTLSELTPDQAQRYAVLRGYTADGKPDGHQKHHH